MGGSDSSTAAAQLAISGFSLGAQYLGGGPSGQPLDIQWIAQIEASNVETLAPNVPAAAFTIDCPACAVPHEILHTGPGVLQGLSIYDPDSVAWWTDRVVTDDAQTYVDGYNTTFDPMTAAPGWRVQVDVDTPDPLCLVVGPEGEDDAIQAAAAERGCDWWQALSTTPFTARTRH